MDAEAGDARREDRPVQAEAEAAATRPRAEERPGPWAGAQARPGSRRRKEPARPRRRRLGPFRFRGQFPPWRAVKDAASRLSRPPAEEIATTYFLFGEAFKICRESFRHGKL